VAMAAKALDQKRAIGLGVAVEVSSTGQLLDRRSIVDERSFPKIEVPELVVECRTADATADTLFTVISPKRDPFNSVIVVLFVWIETRVRSVTRGVLDRLSRAGRPLPVPPAERRLCNARYALRGIVAAAASGRGPPRQPFPSLVNWRNRGRPGLR